MIASSIIPSFFLPLAESCHLRSALFEAVETVIAKDRVRFNLRAPFLLLFGASQKVRGKGKIDYYEKAGFAISIRTT
jgi:hypothetical protein